VDTAPTDVKFTAISKEVLPDVDFDKEKKKVLDSPDFRREPARVRRLARRCDEPKLFTVSEFRRRRLEVRRGCRWKEYLLGDEEIAGSADKGG